MTMVSIPRPRAAASASWSLVPQSPVTSTRHPSAANLATSSTPTPYPASRLAARAMTLPPMARSAPASVAAVVTPSTS